MTLTTFGSLVDMVEAGLSFIVTAPTCEPVPSIITSKETVLLFKYELLVGARTVMSGGVVSMKTIIFLNGITSL